MSGHVQDAVAVNVHHHDHDHVAEHVRVVTNLRGAVLGAAGPREPSAKARPALSSLAIERGQQKPALHDNRWSRIPGKPERFRYHHFALGAQKPYKPRMNDLVRKVLPADRVTPAAAEAAAAFHSDIVEAVEQATRTEPLVVVGMAQNPFVKKARSALDGAGLSFTYLEYGSYFARWKERLAIKLWSGWPTFPQVFVRGVLIGGHQQLSAALADGSLKRMLETVASSDQRSDQLPG